MFGQIINKSMGAIRKRRGAVRHATQRNGEQGSAHCVPTPPVSLCPLRHCPSGPGVF